MNQREAYNESSLSFLLKVCFILKFLITRAKMPRRCIDKNAKETRRQTLLKNRQISTMRKRKTSMDRCSSYSYKTSTFAAKAIILYICASHFACELKIIQGRSCPSQPPSIFPRVPKSFFQSSTNPPFDLQHNLATQKLHWICPVSLKLIFKTKMSPKIESSFRTMFVLSLKVIPN